MTYYSTKTYGHNIGLACVFRQPNADHSHCHLLHGYSLAFRFTFGCKDLDNKNWAVDFGGLKPLKAWLEDKFDHKSAEGFIYIWGLANRLWASVHKK